MRATVAVINNVSNHVIEPVENFSTGVTHDFEPKLSETFFSRCIFPALQLLSMDITIDFDHQSRGITIKVDDIAIDAVLSTEFIAEFIATQLAPQSPLWRSCTFSEVASK